ncbi:hypothetical protein ACGFYV_10665 [Streptomyces sp. NPDC048297]|uniref:hypothetical protein n=1 Tax=Streptomyces sp. NPDC048297 TaxID=3365531 RepID=UPI0037129DA4
MRQASLAPQLRRQRTGEPASGPAPRGDERRTPELVRDGMTAYRDGWTRGASGQPGRGSALEPGTGTDKTQGDPA